MKKIIMLLCFFSISINDTGYCEDIYSVRNLRSTTHTINQPLKYTQISFVWSEPSGLTTLDGYYFLFDQNSDSEFVLNKNNTNGTPINTNQVMLSCSGDEDYYYFHIAPAYYDYTETYDYIFGDTTNKGPYRIDTIAPDLNVTIHQYTSENPVTLTVGTSGATNMCISNIDFDKCEENWSGIDPFPTWSLSKGNGTKTVYIKQKIKLGIPLKQQLILYLILFLHKQIFMFHQIQQRHYFQWK